MNRRRRQARETAFSFDSFLDLVTNVVGIIIRLILVAWVGARSYSSIAHMVKPDAPPSDLPPITASDDPLQQDLERQRAELARTQEKLLEELRRLDLVKDDHQLTEKQLAALAARHQALDSTRTTISRSKDDVSKKSQDFALTLDELEKRRQKLSEEMKALEKQPVPKALHYRTPVSETVKGDEVHFECKEGRVTYINLAELLPQVRRSLHDNEKLLQTQWEVSDVTEPIGAFRLRYTIERSRDALESASGASPDRYGAFGYGMSSWRVEAVTRDRGEPMDVAMRPDSDFRRTVDPLGKEQTAVTLWVYPDSFALYRKLRDYLTDLGFTVSGRPLPEGYPIAGSRSGTKSRGQ